MNPGESDVIVVAEADGKEVRSIIIGGEIVSAIAIALRASFNTTELAAIYKNKNQQDFATPCAFIHQINRTHRNLMRGRGERSVIIDVRVHPSKTETKVDAWADVFGDKVANALNKIRVDQLILKTSNLETVVEDDVLHVIASYSFMVKEVALTEDQMQELNIEERVI